MYSGTSQKMFGKKRSRQRDAESMKCQLFLDALGLQRGLTLGGDTIGKVGDIEARGKIPLGLEGANTIFE